MNKIELIKPAAMAKELTQIAFENLQASIDDRGNAIERKKAGLSDLERALSDFRKALGDLTAEGSMVRFKSSSSDSRSASVATTGDSKPGTFRFKVKQLATSASTTTKSFGNFDAAGAGTLRVTVNGATAEIDLSKLAEPGQAASPQDLADAINSDPALAGKAIAVLVPDGDTFRLSIQSRETGAATEVEIDASDVTDKALQDALSGAVPKSGQDLIYFLNGDHEEASAIRSASNTIRHAGTQITFLQEGGDQVSITVENDESGTEKAMRAFVDAFNGFRKIMDTLTKAGNKMAGVLGGPFEGESAVNSLTREMVHLLNGTYDGVYVVKTGLSMDKEGTLKLDGEAFKAVLKASPDAINRFFGSTREGADGALNRMYAATSAWLDGDKSQIKLRNEAARREEESFKREYARLSERYIAMEDSLRQRFEAVKRLQENLNAVLSMLEDQFEPSKS